MDRIRAFVALPLPEIARARLAALRHAADVAAPVRWVAPDAIHLTLKFLGEIEPARVEVVKEALTRRVGERGAFDFTLAGVGGFPALARPRVLWAGVSGGAPAVVALAERVEAALEPLGFPREARRFTPHVTIGRVKDSPARAPRDSGRAIRRCGVARTECRARGDARALPKPPIVLGRTVLAASSDRALADVAGVRAAEPDSWRTVTHAIAWRRATQEFPRTRWRDTRHAEVLALRRRAAEFLLENTPAIS